jgi:hypothetical protein
MAPRPTEMTGDTTRAVSDAVDFARGVKADRHRAHAVRTLGDMAALYQLSWVRNAAEAAVGQTQL